MWAKKEIECPFDCFLCVHVFGHCVKMNRGSMSQTSQASQDMVNSGRQRNASSRVIPPSRTSSQTQGNFTNAVMKSTFGAYYDYVSDFNWKLFFETLWRSILLYLIRSFCFYSGRLYSGGSCILINLLTYFNKLTYLLIRYPTIWKPTIWKRSHTAIKNKLSDAR